MQNAENENNRPNVGQLRSKFEKNERKSSVKQNDKQYSKHRVASLRAKFEEQDQNLPAPLGHRRVTRKDSVINELDRKRDEKRKTYEEYLNEEKEGRGSKKAESIFRPSGNLKQVSDYGRPKLSKTDEERKRGSKAEKEIRDSNVKRVSEYDKRKPSQIDEELKPKTDLDMRRSKRTESQSKRGSNQKQDSKFKKVTEYEGRKLSKIDEERESQIERELRGSKRSQLGRDSNIKRDSKVKTDSQSRKLSKIDEWKSRGSEIRGSKRIGSQLRQESKGLSDYKTQKRSKSDARRTSREDEERRITAVEEYPDEERLKNRKDSRDTKSRGRILSIEIGPRKESDGEKRKSRKDVTTEDKAIEVKMKDPGYKNGTTNGTIDPAFRKIKKHFTAFVIWRIENLNVIALPKEQYGTFFDEDSYIIYAASPYGQPSGPQAVSRELKGGLEFHIHFWLGKRTTSDKAGIAAYKTVELDSYLGGRATQHREVQGSESPRLKSYFRQGIRVLKGGTAAGFRQVTDTFEPRLYQVKGKRAPIVTQMSDVSWKHFNSGDVFLVHTKTILFVWVGRAANAVEKLHGTKAAMQLRTEQNTPNMVFVDDGYEKTMYDEDKQVFEQYLPLSERFVAAADEVTADEIAEKRHRANIKLYQCSDSSGKYRVTEIKSGPLRQNDLNSADVFILDHGLNGIWVWVGRKASQKERVEAMRNARGFVKKKKYPSYTAVTRVVDGAEPVEFKMLFMEWTGKEETKGMAHGVAKIKVTKFDAGTMHDRPALAAKSQLIDDGSGTIKIWRIRKFEAVELSKERHGIFFTGDCYIISYNYRSILGNRSILYYWLGLHSTQDDQGVAALKTIEIDLKQGGTAMQVRVVQGREPANFLQLFKGKMKIFNGKGIDYDATGKNLKTPHTYLLQVQGSTTYNSKAVQLNIKASSLNSNYCYVLKKGNYYFVWCGTYSNGDNREMAKGFAGADFALLSEGSESAEYWNAIGGKSDYFTGQITKEGSDEMPARLFQCSTATGQFKAEEILNFVQTDLAPEDVMLLDAHETIFLWIGNLSTKEEQKLSLQTASEYLKTDPAGRDIKTSIVQIKQGNEAPIFTGFFPAWDDSLWKEHRSYEDLRSEIETSTNQDIKRIISTGPRDSGEFDNYHKYSTTVLKAPKDKLPSSVDPLKKELHLTYDDFVGLFKMEYKEFEKLPFWKQQEMKKKNGLF